MRILSLSFVAAALALAFTPALHAQENTSRVRQAYLRAQDRQQQVRRAENAQAKLNAWIAKNDAQERRAAWVAKQSAAPQTVPSRDMGAELASSIRPLREAQAFTASEEGAASSRPMIRRQRWADQHNQQNQAAESAPAQRSFRAERAARAEQAPAPQARVNSQAEAPRRAVRPAGGRVQRASDQPSTRSASRSRVNSGSQSAARPQAERGR